MVLKRVGKRRGRVEDAHEEEEYNLLMERIGVVQAKRIMIEEQKRRKDKFLVRMCRLGDFPRSSVEK